MNKKFKWSLAVAAIICLFFPFIIRGIYEYNDIPTDGFIFLSIDQVLIGLAAGFIASLILDSTLKESIVKFEDRIVSLLMAFNALGIDGIAKRGGATTISRNMVPEAMIKSAKAEIMILAASGKGTIVKQNNLLQNQLIINPLLKLGFILMDPKSDFALQYKLENGETLASEINEVIESLKKLRQKFGNKRVELRLLASPPTFTSTAIDTEILTDNSGYGIMGIQPRLEGDMHHGLIIDIKKKDDGLWLTFKKAIEHYWLIAKPYDLG